MVLSDYVLRQDASRDNLTNQTKVIWQQSDVPAQAEPYACQVQRRFSPVEQVKVAELYQPGTQMNELAIEFGTL